MIEVYNYLSINHQTNSTPRYELNVFFFLGGSEWIKCFSDVNCLFLEVIIIAIVMTLEQGCGLETWCLQIHVMAINASENYTFSGYLTIDRDRDHFILTINMLHSTNMVKYARPHAHPTSFTFLALSFWDLNLLSVPQT